MTVQIDLLRCDGCEVCIDGCPGDVLRINTNTQKAYSKYSDDCWYCGACAEDCPQKAIKVVFPYLVR